MPNSKANPDNKKVVLIDARIIASSTGTYVRQLLNHLQPEDDIEYQALMGQANFNLVKNPHIKLIDFEHKSYGIKDQLIDQVQLSRQITRLKPDLVHYTLPFAPFLSRAPFVVTFHDFNRFDFPLADRLQHLAFVQQTQLSLRRARHIITPTDYVRDDLLKRFRWLNKTSVSRTYEAGDLTTDPVEPIPELVDKQFFLHVGSGKHHKNIGLVLDVWHKYSDQINTQLAVIGGFKRHELGDQGPLSEQIITPGWVNEAQKRWAYENCRGYITASLSEGFGLTGVEAMAAGAPVISSNATCLPEVYADAAIYFDPHSGDELLNAIKSLNDQRAKELSLAGKQRAAQFSWSKMAQETTDIYRQTISS